MQMNEKFDIKDKIFSIFIRTKCSLFLNKIFLIWFLLVSLLIASVFYGEVSIQKSFEVKILLAPGITGLSFTLALMTATTRVFDEDKLTNIFLSDVGNDKQHELYDLMGAYLLTGLLWVLVALIALADSALNISVLPVQVMMIALTAGAILSLWNLLYGHIRDIMLDVRNNANKLLQEETDLGEKKDSE